ncbi:hypothetical protein GOP47_0014098, partial [Adiantum capillus-veneris]
NKVNIVFVSKVNVFFVRRRVTAPSGLSKRLIGVKGAQGKRDSRVKQPYIEALATSCTPFFCFGRFYTAHLSSSLMHSPSLSRSRRDQNEIAACMQQLNPAN